MVLAHAFWPASVAGRPPQMVNEPYLGRELPRLLEVEWAFFHFFATGDLSPFYESGLYSWNLNHVAVLLADCVTGLTGMLAGLHGISVQLCIYCRCGFDATLLKT
eukprot:SAG22_NODE_5973_length_923_cov_1.496359_2_plen_105_part_00